MEFACYSLDVRNLDCKPVPSSRSWKRAIRHCLTAPWTATRLAQNEAEIPAGQHRKRGGWVHDFLKTEKRAVKFNCCIDIVYDVSDLNGGHGFPPTQRITSTAGERCPSQLHGHVRLTSLTHKSDLCTIVSPLCALMFLTTPIVRYSCNSAQTTSLQNKQAVPIGTACGSTLATAAGRSTPGPAFGWDYFAVFPLRSIATLVNPAGTSNSEEEIDFSSSFVVSVFTPIAISISSG